MRVFFFCEGAIVSSRSILAAAIFAVSGAIAHAQTAPGSAAPTPLTGIQAWVALVGNTVSGKIDGKDYTDFYMADGTVKSMEGSVLSTGRWSLEGQQICFKYPREQRDCYTLEVVGKVATFKGKDGVGLRLDILDGNPKNL